MQSRATEAASHDVVIIGAGPVGALAAHAFAQRGARVALLEANPQATSRFAGEWIHPPGVEALERLHAGRLEEHGARVGYGFAVIPDDGSALIELPYPDGSIALACEHRGMVASLRSRALGHRDVTYLPGTRAVAITDRGVMVVRERSGTPYEVQAHLVIGAEGRSSLTARHLGAGEGELQSYMAAVELRDVDLPREGFGHVVLGGPGPALLYRLDDDRVRACLDVPLALGAAARTPQFLWDAFAPAFSPRLRAAFRHSLQDGDVMWAANRFRPRAHYRSGRVIAIGDAVGHCHPLTAIGLTQGFLDAEAAVTESAHAYPGHRPRDSFAAELLANTLYQVMRRDDRCASAIRSAMYDAWRANASLRERSMELLTAGGQRAAEFGALFGRIAASALAHEVRDVGLVRRGALSRAASFRQWVPWAVAAVVPHLIRSSYRARMTANEPLPGIHASIDDAEHVSVASSVELDRNLLARANGEAVDVLQRFAIDGSSKLEVADATTRARRAAPILHAIELAAEEPAIREWARHGRRRLATGAFAAYAVAHAELAEQADCDPAYVVADLAQMLLTLLDAPTAGRDPITGYDDAVRDLLHAQGRDGGFGDPIITELACRALRLVAMRAGAADPAIERSLAEAAHWLRSRHNDDGSQPGAKAVPHTSAAIEAWIACGVPATDPVVRRAVRWLVGQQTPHGRWHDASGVQASALATARAVAALATTNSHFRGARDLGVTALVDIVSSQLLVRDHHGVELRDAAYAPTLAEALRAMALAARADRERLVTSAGRAGRSGRGPEISDDDLSFCRRALEEVSRTFARPIAMLPDTLSTAVGCGYLLCRIADTIEDHPGVPLEERDRMFAIFLATLEGGDPHPLALGFEAIAGEDPELSLGRNCARVIRVLESLGADQRAACRRWIAEMARGMNLYVHRLAGPDGIVALTTLADLERYCYFVAGTVGHLLTDLFATEFDPAIVPTLRVDAEHFGAGLQMVNILKDITDDRSHGWSYIPRSACAEQGIGVAELTDLAHREAAHAAVAPVFEMARERLDGALRYALTVPASHTGVRLFCLLPLWMAVRTLMTARGNDAMFVTGEEVKISRAEVEAIIVEVMQLVADNDGLTRRYQAMWSERP